MTNLLKSLSLMVLLMTFSSSASALIWGEGNWGDNWGEESSETKDPFREPQVAPPADPVPISQKVRPSAGGETDAAISAGAYADNGSPTFDNSFTPSDFITIIAEISPDPVDVGKDGDLIVVLLSIISGQQQWSFLNEDGNFESWDLKIPTLGAAKSVSPLEESHSITIFEGELQAGRHRMAVGYWANGGDLIYTAKAINITVE